MCMIICEEAWKEEENESDLSDKIEKEKLEPDSEVMRFVKF